MMKQASDPGAGNVWKELLRQENTAIYRTLQTYREDGEIPNGRTRIPRWDVRWSSLYEMVVMEPERGAGRLLRPTTQIKPSSCPIHCRHVNNKPDRCINVQNRNPNKNEHLYVYFVKNNVNTSLKEDDIWKQKQPRSLQNSMFTTKSKIHINRTQLYVCLRSIF